MVRGMFAAISGLKTHQVMLDVTANDISNVNTIGYKSTRMTFKDSLTQLQKTATGANAQQGGSNSAQVGLGTQLGSIDNLMGAGALQTTGNPLDIAIQGDGFFRIGLGDPATGTLPAEVEYTRAGNFARNQQGYLVTQDGYYVMGLQNPGPAAAGAPNSFLLIPPGATNIAVAQDGSVSYIKPTDPAFVLPAGHTDIGNGRARSGYVSMATFPNAPGLERNSGNRWIASASSGAETRGTPGQGFGVTTAGAIEGSNVDLASTFTNMITAQRGFQASSRVISTSDEMLSDLVNLKR